MPPRIKPNRILSSLSSSTTLPSSSSTIITSHNISQIAQLKCPFRRQFSSSRVAQTRLREIMFDWLNSQGADLKHHIPGSTNYVTQLRNKKASDDASESSRRGSDEQNENGPGSRSPFPLNPLFISEPILSDALCNEIYKRVVTQKKSVRSVSVELRVDMRRVGAVVRLMEIERRMKKEVCQYTFLFRFLPTPYNCSDEQTSISLEDSGIPSSELVTNHTKLQLSESFLSTSFYSR